MQPACNPIWLLCTVKVHTCVFYYFYFYDNNVHHPRITRTASHECQVCGLHCVAAEAFKWRSHVCIILQARCATLSHSASCVLFLWVWKQSSRAGADSRAAASHYVVLSSQRGSSFSDESACLFEWCTPSKLTGRLIELWYLTRLSGIGFAHGHVTSIPGFIWSDHTQDYQFVWSVKAAFWQL